jgi:VIT1/CCC1 family predicted Fe2+/Mn2+ transporter
MAHDALGAHVRDELGISDIHTARPIQAALTSAVTFAVGALLPLVAAALSPRAVMIPVVAVASLLLLCLLGGAAARAGGASALVGSVRVVFWSALAMGLTASAGILFGAAG